MLQQFRLAKSNELRWAALSSQLLILDRPFDVVDMARGQAILAWLKAHGYTIVLTADQQWVKQQATNLFTV